MRRYYDPIQVKVGDGPMQFIWRGQLMVVTEIQGQWIRSLPWWNHVEWPTDLLAEQEVWRVEAGNASKQGIYELARSTAEGWHLVGVCD